MARLRVALRRSFHPESEPVFTNGSLKVDLSKREVQVDGKLVSLTPTEYDLLKTFIKYAGKVLTHTQLLRLIWGTAYEHETHMLQVNISNLRRKIEPDPFVPASSSLERASGTAENLLVKITNLSPSESGPGSGMATF
jgi:two-component system KDP operon response regulator KdpE